MIAFFFASTAPFSGVHNSGSATGVNVLNPRDCDSRYLHQFFSQVLDVIAFEDSPTDLTELLALDDGPSVVGVGLVAPLAKLAQAFGEDILQDAVPTVKIAH
jgi:hypothetical protein